MMSASSLATLAIGFFFPAFFVVLCLTLVLASFGKSLGIRKLYVKVLTKVFLLARKLVREADREKASFTIGGGGGGSTEEESGDEDHSHVGDAVDGDEEDVTFMRRKLNQMGKVSRHNVISRKDNLILTPNLPPIIEVGSERHVPLTQLIMQGETVSASTFQREFQLEDVLDYVKTGIASIIEDEVTQRFVAEELKSWNLLTRTSQSFEFVNTKLTVIWIVGFLFRYCILLPGRFCILFVGLLWLAICMTFIGTLNEGHVKRKLYYYAYTSCFQVLGGSLSAVIHYHNADNKPVNGICVANHTSPLDVLVLAGDNAYDLVGQRYTSGLLKFFQDVLSNCSDHIWFERSESKDRLIVGSRLARLKADCLEPSKGL